MEEAAIILDEIGDLGRNMWMVPEKKPRVWDASEKCSRGHNILVKRASQQTSSPPYRLRSLVSSVERPDITKDFVHRWRRSKNTDTKEYQGAGVHEPRTRDW